MELRSHKKKKNKKGICPGTGPKSTSKIVKTWHHRDPLFTTASTKLPNASVHQIQNEDQDIPHTTSH